MPLPIKAITFDLDDTLWDIWPIIDRAEARLHDWLEQNHPEIPKLFTAQALRRLSGEIAKQHPDRGHDRTWTRKEALRQAARHAKAKAFCEHTAFDVFFTARNEVTFYEDVLPVLQRLTRRYTLGALSNGNADIKLVGLADVLDFAINAIDTGRPKPEPAMFQAAIQRLGVAPEQIVHVGDEPRHDVMGAAKAGLRTVWVNRNQTRWPGGPRADAEVKDFLELERVIAGWAGEFTTESTENTEMKRER